MKQEELKKIIENEPSLAVFKKTKDIIMLLARHPDLGFWRGYIAVSPAAPKHYIDALDDCSIDYDVHGGVTYRGNHKEFGSNYQEWLFIGFDCGHAGDMLVNMREFSNLSHLYQEGETYRDYEYALSETNKLYEQIIAKAEKSKREKNTFTVEVSYTLTNGGRIESWSLENPGLKHVDLRNMAAVCLFSEAVSINRHHFPNLTSEEIQSSLRLNLMDIADMCMSKMGEFIHLEIEKHRKSQKENK